jgi:lipase chaperone LimK
VWAGAGLLALIAWWALAPARPPMRLQTVAPSPPPSLPPPPSPPPPPSTLPLPLAASVAAPAGPVPARSLRGTEVDGALELDGAGRFVATPRALQLFDYFATTEGEADAATRRAQVQAVAQQRLPPAEVAAALALYDRYLAYRQALQAAFERAPPGADARAALAIARATAVELFGPDDAEQLFAADHALAEVTLARAELARAELEPAERAARLAALEQRLPEPMRQARARRAELRP